MSSLLEGAGRLIKVLFGTLAAVVLIVLVTAGLLYYHFAKDLPRFTEIKDYRPPIVSEVFADDGTKIGEFWQECRFLVPFEKIPRQVINAFVASEDERFWEHKGVDFRSILRAAIENLQAGHVVQGGSTITQQVARSLVLTREKRLSRKIKEAILATQLEQSLSKEQILTLYLNEIFLGNRSYGIAAAARNYFHKDLNDLTLAEISMIAGLPSAPTNYSPINNYQMARERQVHVLNRMLTNNTITRSEQEEALAAPLKVYRAGTDKDFNNRFAPYFVEHVRRHIEETWGQETLYRGGLRIETTASIRANRLADQAVKRGLLEMERKKGFRGPIGTVAPSKIRGFAEGVHREIVEFQEPILLTGAADLKALSETPLEAHEIYKGVIAPTDEKRDEKKKGTATATTVWVGRSVGIIRPEDRAWAQEVGRTPKVGEVYWVKRKEANLFTIEQEPRLESALFSMNPLTGEVKAMVGGVNFKKSEFNRAVQALRQPGSAFKPVIYSAALDKGYRPKTMVIDAPVVYQVGRNDTWSPKNYGNKFNGPMSVRAALTHSVNIVAVKVFHDIGIDYTLAYARKLGLFSPLHKYLSSALGASDLTLMELTRAYGTFPAGGVRPEAIFIRKVTDREGKVIEENQPIQTTKIDPAHVFDGVGQSGPKGGLNTDLMIEGEKTIQSEKFRLSPEEKRILYGAAIPLGHVITPRTAFLMVDLMKGVVDHGTGFRAKALNRPAAGKTGTTNDESDAWFIGYTPDLITGVWVGYDTRKPIGKGMTGGVVAAPIWLYFMQDFLKDRPVLDFARPADITLAEIDSMTGGSVLEESKPEPDETSSTGQPASRGVDFLYQDLKKL